MEWIIKLLAYAVAFFVGSKLLKGISITSFTQAVVVMLVVAVLDMTLGTVLKIVTLGILSIGIFNWFLNALLIQVADWFLPEFEVENFWWALGLAAFVSIAASVVEYVI